MGRASVLICGACSRGPAPRFASVPRRATGTLRVHLAFAGFLALLVAPGLYIALRLGTHRLAILCIAVAERLLFRARTTPFREARRRKPRR